MSQTANQHPGKLHRKARQPAVASHFAIVVEQYLNQEALKQAEAHHPPRQPEPGELLRNYPRPQEELDLHGLTAEEAAKSLRRFVDRCREIDLLTLRVITGKGLHSEGEPVLPALARKVLAELEAEQRVLAWCRERRRRGGNTGSLLVYLPRRPGNRP